MAYGLRTHLSRLHLDSSVALEQHREYCRTLQQLGAQVISLGVSPNAPDSVFIEDTAVVLDELAVLASMGNPARRDEPPAVEPVLRRYRDVERIELPATLEGGDVLVAGRMLLVGLSSRTNAAGITALEEVVQRHGFRVTTVSVRGCLHLKTACTLLPDGTLLVNAGWLDIADLGDFELIPVPSNEPWAANTLTVNGTVVLAAEYERTGDLIRKRGFRVQDVPLSEFAKAEGGATCLSLIFEAV
jgi:dimethylargininase